VGRIGAISAPLLVGLLYPVLGFGGVFAMTTVVLAAGVCAVIVLGPQTKGRSLEAIAAEEGSR
jgi:putative MFS transporter